MSDSSHHDHKSSAPHITTEDPNVGVNAKMIVMVGVVSLLAFIASAIIGYIMLVRDEKMIAAAGPQNPTAEMESRKEIGIVDFAHYDNDDRLPTWRAEMAGKLAGYSWADKSKGKVRLPIAEGIKRVIAEATTGTAIGEGNAKVMHEPNVPRLTLQAVVADPTLALPAATATTESPVKNSVPAASKAAAKVEGK
jgi:hypothetical protein